MATGASFTPLLIYCRFQILLDAMGRVHTDDNDAAQQPPPPPSAVIYFTRSTFTQSLLTRAGHTRCLQTLQVFSRFPAPAPARVPAAVQRSPVVKTDAVSCVFASSPAAARRHHTHACSWRYRPLRAPRVSSSRGRTLVALAESHQREELVESRSIGAGSSLIQFSLVHHHLGPEHRMTCDSLFFSASVIASFSLLEPN